jgi:hypothetical protein
MPYLGAPFVAEGSAEGLFETMALIRSLQPRVLVHGHPPLTDIFTVEALPAIESALRELHQRVRTAVGDGRTLAESCTTTSCPFPCASTQGPSCPISSCATTSSSASITSPRATGIRTAKGVELAPVE